MPNIRRMMMAAAGSGSAPPESPHELWSWG